MAGKEKVTEECEPEEDHGQFIIASTSTLHPSGYKRKFQTARSRR
jgi:hypothetical protein